VKVKLGEIAFQRAAQEFCQCACVLHARGPPAHDGKRQAAPAALRIRVRRGALEIAEDVIPQAHGVIQGLEGEGVVRRPRNPVEMRRASRGEDQIIVGNISAAGPERAPGEIDSLHIG